MEESLTEFVGEPLGFFVCDTERASYVEKDYAQTCENCESVTIARWVNGTWKEISEAYLQPKQDAPPTTRAHLACHRSMGRNA